MRLPNFVSFGSGEAEDCKSLLQFWQAGFGLTAEDDESSETEADDEAVDGKTLIQPQERDVYKKVKRTSTKGWRMSLGDPSDDWLRD